MEDAPEYADPSRYVELAAFEGGWRDLWWNRDFLHLMAHRLGLARARRALDVGCGAGHWGRTLLPYLHPDAGLVGVDQEPAFLDHARRGAAQREWGERCNYVVGTAEALPFEDSSFDLVTCQTVLIHVTDAAAVIEEMKRVLRPGGVMLLAEPDNRAGNIALLGGEPTPPDEDILDIVRLQLQYDRGKRALGEGDNAVGVRLPGLLAAAGLQNVAAHTNDRCNPLFPPYERPAMKVAIEQEMEWARDDVTILTGTRKDSWRFVQAGGGTEAEFEQGWAALMRWLRGFVEGVPAGRYHCARGFVFYLVAGTKPSLG